MGRKFNVRKEAMMKTNLRKSKLYSRYGKEIYMLAKEKGANPESNLGLKHLIEKAKRDEVPNSVIERNIKKAESGIGEDYSPTRYEGFGPGGTGIIVDTLTDNVNRTVGEVRSCFTKAHCSLGVNGSVEHSYRHLSYISIKGMDQEEALDALIMADLDLLDIDEDENLVEIEANGFDEDKIIKALQDASDHVTIVEHESGWYPMDYIELSEEDYQANEKLINQLNELDDVQEIYHNAKQKQAT